MVALQASKPSSSGGEVVGGIAERQLPNSPGSVGPEVRDGRVRRRVHASKHCVSALGGFDRDDSTDEAQQRGKDSVIARPFSHGVGEEAMQHSAGDDKRKKPLP